MGGMCSSLERYEGTWRRMLRGGASMRFQYNGLSRKLIFKTYKPSILQTRLDFRRQGGGDLWMRSCCGSFPIQLGWLDPCHSEDLQDLL